MGVTRRYKSRTRAKSCLGLISNVSSFINLNGILKYFFRFSEEKAVIVDMDPYGTAAETVSGCVSRSLIKF